MVDFAYFPNIIGRGEQIRLLAAEHGIELRDIKNKDTPMGTVPLLKDGNITLNDSAAIMLYLVKKYPGDATPWGIEIEAKCLEMWSVQQDYYSFVLSPMHDVFNAGKDAGKDPTGRNLRNVDISDPDERLKNLVKLHKKRCDFLEKRLVASGTTEFSCGSSFTYADIFLYTNVRRVQLCSKFESFRAACGVAPFEAYPTICAIADKVQVREKILPTAGNFAHKPF